MFSVLCICCVCSECVLICGVSVFCICLSRMLRMLGVPCMVLIAHICVYCVIVCVVLLFVLSVLCVLLRVPCDLRDCCVLCVLRISFMLRTLRVWCM